MELALTYRLVFTDDQRGVEFDAHDTAQALTPAKGARQHHEAQLWREDGRVCTIRRNRCNSWTIV